MFTAQVLPTAKFLSTLSLRRATKACRTWTYERLISIHALLAESDGASSKYMSYGWDFYPRSPCGERRSAADLPRPVQDFYPRSPCGERQVLRYGVLTASLISIHALLAESDPRRYRRWPAARPISIHALLAESDLRRWRFAACCPISIHALLAESDQYCPCLPLHTRISIHALLAESDAKRLMQQDLTIKFLSTLSLRRATNGYDGLSQVTVFLSTLSLRRATTRKPLENLKQLYFYPRSPCGERRMFTDKRHPEVLISIHALLAESDPRPGRSGDQ